MKKWIFIATVIFLTACGASNNNTDLSSLKKQKEEIEKKIKELETKSTKDSTKNTGKSISVAVVTLEPTSFDHFVEIQGRLDGDENVGATSQTLGVVKTIFVEPGQSVKKGQVLAELDGSVMEQTLKELQASLEFVTDVYNRQKALWEQNVGSEIQYLQAKSNKESLEQRIKTMKEQMDMTKIVAPITGNVEDCPVKVGQAMSPGMVAFRVVNFNRVKVVADVSETYSSNISKGDKAIMFFPDLKHEVTSEVNFASKFINPVNRTFTVEIKFIPEKNFEYKANMIAVTKINDYHNDKAIVISLNYLKSDEKSDFVYLEKNGVAKKHYVKTGHSYNGNIEIIEGLESGDKLITAGHNELEEGQNVEVVK